MHLTLNAEHDRYRWGPITHAPSLLDGDGGFPRTVTDVWDHADVDEVRRECRTQLERAVLWGFDATHLDSHLDVLPSRPEFFDVYLELALDFALPLRLPDPSVERTLGFPVRKLAAEEGAVFPDHVVRVPGPVRPALARLLGDLPPGVTEIAAAPAIDTPELRAGFADWPARVDDHRVLVEEDQLRALVEKAGGHLIGWRPLRELARAAS